MGIVKVQESILENTKLVQYAKGKGRVLLRIPPDFNCDVGILKCAYCNGSGEHPGRYALCPTCGGAGSVWVGSLKEY